MCTLWLQVKSDDTTHHLISQKIMRSAELPHVQPVDGLTQRARRSAHRGRFAQLLNAMPCVAHVMEAGGSSVLALTQQLPSCAHREAAAKLNANKEVILRDCATRSGIFTGSTGVNGEHWARLRPWAMATCMWRLWNTSWQCSNTQC